MVEGEGEGGGVRWEEGREKVRYRKKESCFIPWFCSQWLKFDDDVVSQVMCYFAVSGAHLTVSVVYYSAQEDRPSIRTMVVLMTT